MELRLTPAEKAVLERLLLGDKQEAAAVVLKISRTALRERIARARRRVAMASTLQLVAWAVSKGHLAAPEAKRQASGV